VLVKVFYNSNAALEDWHAIELLDVCPLAMRKIVERAISHDPAQVSLSRPNRNSPPLQPPLLLS